MILAKTDGFESKIVTNLFYESLPFGIPKFFFNNKKLMVLHKWLVVRLMADRFVVEK